MKADESVLVMWDSPGSTSWLIFHERKCEEVCLFLCSCKRVPVREMFV